MDGDRSRNFLKSGLFWNLEDSDHYFRVYCFLAEPHCDTSQDNVFLLHAFTEVNSHGRHKAILGPLTSTQDSTASDVNKKVSGVVTRRARSRLLSRKSYGPRRWMWQLSMTDGEVWHRKLKIATRHPPGAGPGPEPVSFVAKIRTGHLRIPSQMR
jgi:hypothetical protein